MRDNYERSLALVLQHEGGYVNHPDDPGGETNRGITARTYASYRINCGLPERSVREITDQEVSDIYYRNYWCEIEGDELPPGIDYATFDSAVNSGPARGAKWLQHALLVTIDGSIGPQTIAAAKAADPVKTIGAMCDLRLEFLRGLGTWATFGRGWQRRVDDVRRVATEMAKAPPTQVFTASGEWAKPTGTQTIIVTTVGSGGEGSHLNLPPDPPVPWYVALIRAIRSLFGRK